jgi:hypothetical protein
MGIKFRFPSRPADFPIVAEQQRPADDEHTPGQTGEKGVVVSDAKPDFEEEVVNKDFQHGVQVAQAVTQVWTKQHLIAAYVL